MRRSNVKSNNNNKSGKSTRSNANMNKSGRTHVSYDGDSDTKKDKCEYNRMTDRSKPTNDPRWYGAYPELLRDAASIPFSWSSGTLTDLTGNSQISNTFRSPGIMALGLVPSIGRASNNSDPVNVASTAIYSYVRHANSGSANYDSPDLMIYLLAMTQVYSAITWLERIYSEVTLYSQRNRYLPRGLVFAENVDFDDVNMHLADFRYGINILINKAASLSVPNDMSIFNRHAFLYQNIYTEGTSVKDQLYMYVPQAFWKFAIPTSGGAGSLVSQPVGGLYGHAVWKADQLIQFVGSLLDPIIGSEDMNIMSGDILKAYGQDKLIKLVSLDEVRPIAPIFDIAVLEQMKNATIVYTNSELYIDVTQNVSTNALQSSPMAIVKTTDSTTDIERDIVGLLQSYAFNRLLTTTTYDATPELVMESTRLMAAASGVTMYNNGNKWLYIPLYTGTEVAVSCSYISYKGSNLDSMTVSCNWEINSMGSAISGFIGFAQRISRMSNFDFAPLFQPILSMNGTWQHSEMIWDIDNYAVLTPQDLQRIHEAALLSEFSVPILNRL